MSENWLLTDYLCILCLKSSSYIFLAWKCCDIDTPIVSLFISVSQISRKQSITQTRILPWAIKQSIFGVPNMNRLDHIVHNMFCWYLWFLHFRFLKNGFCLRLELWHILLTQLKKSICYYVNVKSFVFFPTHLFSPANFFLSSAFHIFFPYRSDFICNTMWYMVTP